MTLISHIDTIKPKVSILVPCYNVEAYVRECLNSLINQTLSEIEIICINDGSTDNTGSILQSFQSCDHRIKIINKENTGYGDSMNIGLSYCRGEYVGIVESDDFIEPTMYQDLYANAKKYELDQIRSGYFLYKDGQDISEHLFPEVLKETVFKPVDQTKVFYLPPAIWASIYNLDWLKKNKIKFLPTPGASYQDRSFSFKTLYCCKRFMMLNKAYLHYRQHAGNSVKSPNKVQYICQEWEEIFNFLRDDKTGLSKGVWDVLIPLSLKSFRSNYKRLDPKFRSAFLNSCAQLYANFSYVSDSYPSLSTLNKLEYKALNEHPNLYGAFLRLKHLLLRHIL